MIVILENVQLIVYDFDGVLTDNRVILREDGLESVIVNRSDGLAISIIKNLEIKQVILTTETNRIVETRASKLGVPVIKGVQNKKEILEEFCMENHIALESVVYIGNDINDLAAMKEVGYPMCPSDAYDEIKKVSKIVLKTKGGLGVVRELLSVLQGVESE